MLVVCEVEIDIWQHVSLLVRFVAACEVEVGREHRFECAWTALLHNVSSYSDVG
jgi:hypothetical protein